MIAFTEPKIVPFEGISGEWVERGAYKRDGKSFGYFQCNYCQKNWMSAHAQKRFKQACKDCNRYFLPTHLWKNDEKIRTQKEKGLKDNDKPHLKHLCEACKKGQCVESLGSLFGKMYF